MHLLYFQLTDSECYPENDPCKRAPCMNGGVCGRSTESIRGFVCSCKSFWTGFYCEKRISLCELAEAEETSVMQQTFMLTKRNMVPPDSVQFKSGSSVCLNGGICVDHPTLFTFFCKCLSGWTGDRCEVELENVCSLNNKIVAPWSKI